MCHQVPSEEKLMINLQYDSFRIPYEKEEVMEYNQIVNQTLILLTIIMVFKKIKSAIPLRLFRLCF